MTPENVVRRDTNQVQIMVRNLRLVYVAYHAVRPRRELLVDGRELVVARYVQHSAVRRVRDREIGRPLFHVRSDIQVFRPIALLASGRELIVAVRFAVRGREIGLFFVYTVCHVEMLARVELVDVHRAFSSRAWLCERVTVNDRVDRFDKLDHCVFRLRDVHRTLARTPAVRRTRPRASRADERAPTRTAVVVARDRRRSENDARNTRFICRFRFITRRG